MSNKDVLTELSEVCGRVEHGLRIIDKMNSLRRELTAALARIPCWTPTTDLAALPPFDTYVLVYTTKEFRTIAVRSYNGLGRGWTWRGNGRMYSHDEITHWTPMPEAPEKEVAVTRDDQCRPSTFRKLEDGTWSVVCALCGNGASHVTYQEASVWLTRHLDERHPGWDEAKEAPHATR